MPKKIPKKLRRKITAALEEEYAKLFMELMDRPRALSLVRAIHSQNLKRIEDWVHSLIDDAAAESGKHKLRLMAEAAVTAAGAMPEDGEMPSLEPEDFLPEEGFLP